ncbi:MAG: JAB domain-containing protein [Clostridia bacterium]|nr:JAB domain-containing protein [Clostridia bacterium]
MSRNYVFEYEKEKMIKILEPIAEDIQIEVIANALIRAFKTVYRVCCATSMELLVEVEGVTERIANYLVTVPYFCGFYKIEKRQKVLPINQRIKNQYVKSLSNLDHEELVFVCIDYGNNILSTKTFVGNIDSVKFDIHTIPNFVTTSYKSKLFLLHNHPSGDSSPSFYDIVQTKNILVALKNFDVFLMEHLIVSQKDTYSFNLEKMLAVIRAVEFKEQNVFYEIINSQLFKSKLENEIRQIEYDEFNEEDKLLVATTQIILRGLKN